MDKTQFIQHFKANIRLKLFILFLAMIITGIIIFEAHFHLLGMIIFVIGVSLLLVMNGIKPPKINREK